jgi:hypothetical protein
MVFPTDLPESLLIGDTGESLLTGVEGGEMPFSSCVGTGGPRDEPMLGRRPLAITLVWCWLYGRRGSRGLVAGLFDELGWPGVGTGSREELGSLDLPDVTTGALDDREDPEVATGFLDSVEGGDRFKEPKAGECLLGADGNADTESCPRCLVSVDCALGSEKDLYSCRSVAGGDGSLGAEDGTARLRGVSSGLYMSARPGLDILAETRTVRSGSTGSGSSGAARGSG